MEGGRGDDRAVTEFSFGHITTKKSAYSRLFGFSYKNFDKRKTVLPPPHQNHLLKKKKPLEILFLECFFGDKTLYKKI